MTRATKALLLGGLCIAALSSTPTIVSAFGVSPPFINASKLLNGSRYNATIFLVQGSPTEDQPIKITFDGVDKIRKWISIDKGEEFTIPKGVQQFPIIVTIKVPDDAGLGVYQGRMTISAVSKQAEGATGQSGVTNAVGVQVDLNLIVGERVIQEFTVRKIKILDVREGENPQIAVTVDNTGNVPIGPTRASFDLYDKYGQVRLGFGQVEKLPEVQPFTVEDFVVEFPINIKLAIGEYWAEAKVFKGGDIASELKTIFNVTERKVDYMLYASIAGGIIIVGIFFVILRRRKT